MRIDVRDVVGRGGEEEEEEDMGKEKGKREGTKRESSRGEKEEEGREEKLKRKKKMWRIAFHKSGGHRPRFPQLPAPAPFSDWSCLQMLLSSSSV